MDIQQREARLREFVSGGRICRSAWESVEDGKEMACLLAAWSPETAAAKSSLDCPADSLPVWFAAMIPRVNDLCSDDKWPQVIVNAANAIPKMAKMDADRQERVRILFAIEMLEWAATLEEGSDASLSEAAKLRERLGIVDIAPSAPSGEDAKEWAKWTVRMAMWIAQKSGDECAAFDRIANRLFCLVARN